jgi:phosphoenolpyruvate carboxykinase (GTP)
VSSPALQQWVDQIAELTMAAKITWITGEAEQLEALTQELVRDQTLIPLNPQLRPNSYLARTDPRDVARVEERTYICSENQSDAGPTNNWIDPTVMRADLKNLFAGCMAGRTMFVIPFSMGPLDSPQARFGIEITDSPYVVASMAVMTTVSTQIKDRIEAGAEWVPAVHSVGVPLNNESAQAANPSWPCNPDKIKVVHFPETREIWSFGSGYGGNSLLGKKAMALRIGSVQGRDQGWLAEHMLIMRVTAPTGKQYTLTAAFPSACGKTNFAMLEPNLAGYKIETIGDDIAWLAKNKDGRLVAINPETGFFGVAPGTSVKTNKNAIDAIRSNTIFTNVALTDDGDVWWEGLTDEAPAHLIDWRGNDWTPASGTQAAHPNSRFCVPVENCLTAPPDWNRVEGFEVDAILFGGRRATNVPLVTQANSWAHGVFMGSTISSEQTAAAEGPVGVLRRDPFAMLPFCGYNMADYWAHWLEVGDSLSDESRPQIFQVNWFRKDSTGKFIWPGFSDNIRVVEWIINRLEGQAQGLETPVGVIPAPGELNLDGVKLSDEGLAELFSINQESWLAEAEMIGEYYESFGSHVPEELSDELTALRSRLEQVS